MAITQQQIKIRLFQSTLPVRGATKHTFSNVFKIVISIHAPREGSDAIPASIKIFINKFQSTLPVRGATVLKPPVL